MKTSPAHVRAWIETESNTQASREQSSPAHVRAWIETPVL